MAYNGIETLKAISISGRGGGHRRPGALLLPRSGGDFPSKYWEGATEHRTGLADASFLTWSCTAHSSCLAQREACIGCARFRYTT